MFSFRRVSPFSCGLVALILCISAGSSKAGFQVTLTASAVSKTIVDGGLGDADLLVNNSILVVAEVVGGYTFTFTLATTNTPGSQVVAFVNTSTGSIVDTGGGATTVSVYASANDFTAPTTPPDLQAISAATAQFLSATPSGNTADVSFTAFVDTANALSALATGTVIGSDGPETIVAPGGNADLSDLQLITSLSASYALNLELRAVFGQAGSGIDLDGTLELRPTPEPASLALLSVGALGLAGYGLRRRKTVSA